MFFFILFSKVSRGFPRFAVLFLVAPCGLTVLGVYEANPNYSKGEKVKAEWFRVDDSFGTPLRDFCGFCF